MFKRYLALLGAMALLCASSGHTQAIQYRAPDNLNNVPVSAATPLPTQLNGTTAYTPAPSANAQNAVPPQTSISGACLLAKGAVGNLFSFSVYAPGSTFVYAIDASSAPTNGTVFPAEPMVTLNTFGLLAPPIPVPPSGLVSYSDFFPTGASTGVVICASTNTTAGTFTASTGVVFISAKVL